MRILYHFRTRGSGAEAVHISGIANAFEGLGHTVDFLNPAGVDPRGKASPYAALAAPGLFGRVSHALPRFAFEFLEIAYNAWAWIHLRQLFASGAHDLVYERHAFFLFATAYMARAAGVPLVVEVNELVGDARVSEQPVLRGLVSRCDRAVFSRATLIVVVSPHLKRRIEAMGIDGRKVLVLPNAVDPADYATPADGTAVRTALGLGPENVVIGFLGWFVAWHRLELLIEAFATVARQHPQARLMLVAEGPLREQLAAQVAKLGATERVVFAGSVPHTEVPRHIAAMNVCVVPHSNEYRSPIKLFEYMGQGRAVVAPRTEPIEMVMRDGVNGLLFEPGSASAMAHVLERLVSDAALRVSLGRSARRDVLEQHTWTQNAQAVLANLPSHA
jgi:glycosyltransferase involved in cell wall biosynthesis